MSRMLAALLLVSAALAAPGAAAAADNSLVLQPAADTVAAGGTVDIKVLGLLHPSGKASILVRAADLDLSAKGGGTVAPASADPGETRWVFRAPDAVASDLTVTIEARVRSYPDAWGSCALKVKAPASPKPAPAPTPAPGTAPPAATAGEGDDDGDEVEGAEAMDADPVGNLCTLEKWRVRAEPGDKWTEKKVPPRGETMNAHVPLQAFEVRVNRKDARAVEVQWWRSDRRKRVRVYNDRNKRLEVDKDQDGFPILHFKKEMGKVGASYTFSIVVTGADGKAVRENMVVFWGSEKREEKQDKKDDKKK